MSADVIAFFAKADLLGMDFTEAVQAAIHIERAEEVFGTSGIWRAINAVASGEPELMRRLGVDAHVRDKTGDPSKDGQEAIRLVLRGMNKI